MNTNPKFNVLFIDDEPASLTAFKSVFRDHYHIELATSAEEGYKIMKERDIHIVISDQRMPGTSGVDFLQKIRVEFPETVRMLITGYSDIDAVIRSINGSMVSYYFSKPYDEQEMKAILDNAIEKIKLIRENQELTNQLQAMIDELSEAREQAEESSKLKSALLQNMNHEFRTPMNSILGFAQILRDTLTDETQREFAAIINRSGQRLLKTLNAIVDLARFEADNKPAVIEEFNLSDLTLQLIGEFAEQARRKGIRLSCAAPPQVMIRSNLTFANLIILNLLDNALKFTSQGSITVEITQDTHPSERNVTLSVTDTGIGIDPSHHQKIFGEFKQVSEGIGRYYEGLGIGLALCQRIINRLGGEITLDSEPGKGSTFSVRFPDLTDAPGKPAPQGDQFPSESPTALESRHERPAILIVEDNEYNMELTEVYLSPYYETHKAYDGETAIAMVQDHHYDAILMDINLGSGINGLEALQRIREINGNKALPVIAVTGYSGSDDKSRLLEAGFTAFLPKPFNKSDLEGLLLSILKP